MQSGSIDDGSWGRRVEVPDGTAQIPDTIRTACALLALQAGAQSSSNQPVERGVKWLLRVQQPDDGGWGYSDAVPSQLLPTCLALQALLRLYEARRSDIDDDINGAIRKGLLCICSGHHSHPNGSFGGPDDLRWPHTLLAIKTLGMGAKLGISGPRPERLRDAHLWVESNKDAPRWANEKVILERGPVDGSYQFTHVTPALYLDILGSFIAQGETPSKESLRLGQVSLGLIEHSMDADTHGFGSIRPVSWATARSIMGLAAAKPVFQAFRPDDALPDEASGQQRPSRSGIQQTYLVSLLVLCLLAGALAAFDKLSLAFASLVVLALVCILALSGILREEAVVRLFESVISRLPGFGAKKNENE